MRFVSKLYFNLYLHALQSERCVLSMSNFVLSWQFISNQFCLSSCRALTVSAYFVIQQEYFLFFLRFFEWFSYQVHCGSALDRGGEGEYLRACGEPPRQRPMLREREMHHQARWGKASSPRHSCNVVILW